MKCRRNRTMLNLCGIVAAILKMATARNVSMSGINSGHHNLPTYQTQMISDNVEFWGIVAAILKMAIGRNSSMSGINSGHYYLPIYQIVKISEKVELLTAHILCRVLTAIVNMANILKILKTQNCSSNGHLSLCKMLCLYHYPFRSYQH